MSMEKIQVQKNFYGSHAFLNLVRLKKTWISQKEVYIPFVQPDPTDGKCHKNKITKRFQNQKYISCTQNVQPMFYDRKKISLYTAKHTT